MEINGIEYVTLDSGVLKQVGEITAKYDDFYYKRNNRGEKDIYMSYLRLGFLSAALNGYPSSILEVGYGNGAFLNLAKEVIPITCGYEINPIAEVPEKVQRIDWERVTSRHFDVICFFDSLEHFTDISFLGDLRTEHLIISVPYCERPFDADWLAKWKHLRQGEHFYHFNAITLESEMKKYGFEATCFTNTEDLIRRDGKWNILTTHFQKV
jgi:hypothetical protein